jgi:hypothetical protein
MALTATQPMPSTQPEPADLLWVERWDTTAADPATRPLAARPPAGGFGLRSAYVEEFWLPVLGPSCIVLLRRLDAALADSPGGVTVDLPATARALGLGQRTGRNGPMVRTVQRCCAFGAARLTSAHQLVVRHHLPPLSRRQVSRLPDAMQARHADVMRARVNEPDAIGPDAIDTDLIDADVSGVEAVEAMRSRCRTLAVSLLDLGGDPLAAEAQLHRWRFHPAMAHESVHWALSHLAERRATTGI